MFGCAQRNPWQFTQPPTTVESSVTARTGDRTVVVVGRFHDPSHSPAYAGGVGRFMSDAFSRALLASGKYDVWINPQLSSAVEYIVNQPASQHATELGRLHADNREVRYVVLGKVTDFHHTRELSPQTARWGVLGKRNEAIVAVDLRIVDLRTRRVVGADHITATVPAGSTPSEDAYAGVALDSYLFWSTPLGRASKSTIESAVARTDRVVPRPLIDSQIQRMISDRRVSIAGGWQTGLAKGQELYILARKSESIQREPVRDIHTGLPLRVRIDSVSQTNSTGWVLGERPRELTLRGAVLTATLPEQRSPSRTQHGPLANAREPIEIER